jgi:integrase
MCDEMCDELHVRHTGATVDAQTTVPAHRRLLPGEEERLLEEANPLLHDLIIAALETGCRRGELQSLTWGQVHWADNILLLPASKTKTNQPRAVPMTSRLRAILDVRKHDVAGHEYPPHAFVFGNSVGEQISSIKNGWKTACLRAGIEGLTFHDLRREFASRLLETPGVADHDVRDWLGHANITTTSRYLATTAVRKLQILKRFEWFRRKSSESALDVADVPYQSPSALSVHPAPSDQPQRSQN